MGNSGYQRNMKYKNSHGLERLDVLVPAGTNERLKSMAVRHRVTIGEILEMLLDRGGLAESEPERLLRLSGGDHTKALELLTQEAKAAHPDFRMGAKRVSLLRILSAFAPSV